MKQISVVMINEIKDIYQTHVSLSGFKLKVDLKTHLTAVEGFLSNMQIHDLTNYPECLTEKKVDAIKPSEIFGIGLMTLIEKDQKEGQNVSNIHNISNLVNNRKKHSENLGMDDQDGLGAQKISSFVAKDQSTLDQRNSTLESNRIINDHADIPFRKIDTFVDDSDFDQKNSSSEYNSKIFHREFTYSDNIDLEHKKQAISFAKQDTSNFIHFNENSQQHGESHDQSKNKTLFRSNTDVFNKGTSAIEDNRKSKYLISLDLKLYDREKYQNVSPDTQFKKLDVRINKIEINYYQQVVMRIVDYIFNHVMPAFSSGTDLEKETNVTSKTFRGEDDRSVDRNSQKSVFNQSAIIDDLVSEIKCKDWFQFSVNIHSPEIYLKEHPDSEDYICCRLGDNIMISNNKEFCELRQRNDFDPDFLKKFNLDVDDLMWVQYYNVDIKQLSITRYTKKTKSHNQILNF